MTTRTVLKIVTFVFLLSGIAFLAVGIGIGASEKKLQKRCTEKVTAVVIDNELKMSDSDNGTSYTYTPVFRYTYNNKEYTKKSNYSSSPAVFEEGEETDLYLDPSDPEKYYVPDLKIGKWLSLIFKIIGGAELFVAVIVFVISRRKTYIR